MDNSNTNHSEQTGPLDYAWTFLGSSLAVFAFFCASRLTTGANLPWAEPKNGLQQDAVIMNGYYGAVILTFGLILMGILALRYVKHLNDSGYKWPRMVQFEKDKRDGFISKSSFFVFTIFPLLVSLMSLIKYSASHLACWDATTAITEGFWSSRISALDFSTYICNGDLIRMHRRDNISPEAHEWIWYLTDVNLHPNGATHLRPNGAT